MAEFIDKIMCPSCGKTMAANPSNFYRSYSPRHQGCKVDEAKQFMPYCKNCLQDILSEDSLDTVKEALYMCDKPFLQDLWDSTSTVELGKYPDKTIMQIFGTYIKNTNLQQNRDLRFKDSDRYNATASIDTDEDSSLDNLNATGFLTDKQKCKLQEKYGYGYEDEEYLNFERKYKKLHKSYKEKTHIHTERLIDYIIKKVKEEMAIARGDVGEAKTYEVMAKNAAQAAKLNIHQLSKSDITGGIDLLPQLVEAVEEKASLIPIMTKLKEQPYDDADVIIWSIINKIRRIEEKPMVSYKTIWNFYDEMIEEFFKQKGYTEEQIENEKEKRRVPFRDLDKIYVEPLYTEDMDDYEGDDDGTLE